jgi:hypothetical protein
MPPRLPRAPGLAALALAVLGVAAPAARAQNAATEAYVIRDYVDDVKLADGSTARWHVVLAYDPVSGETVRTVTDEAGRLVERTANVGTLVAPSAEEVAAAEALVRADAEVAALIAAAPQPVVQGGFVLLREAGHPCGPGSRCLQFDVVNVDEAARRVERLRYVVVDLRAGRVVSNDFDPVTQGNVRRPEDPAYDAR